MTKIDDKNFPVLGWIKPGNFRGKASLAQLTMTTLSPDLDLFVRSSNPFRSLLLLTISEPYIGATLRERIDSSKIDPKKLARQKRYYLADSIFDKIEYDLNLRDKLFPLMNELPSEGGLIMARKGIQYVYRICDPVESRKFLDKRELFTLPRFPDTTRWWMIAFYVKDIFMGYECGILDEKGPQMLQNHCICHTSCEPGQFISFVGITLLFLRFAEVETKVAGPGVPTGKRTVLNGEKYFNDTDVKVEFVDSTWFTTLVKSEGFGVKGHFRLVPTGSRDVSLQDRPRKLTWIADFQKTGYTRKAKVLTQQDL